MDARRLRIGEGLGGATDVLLVGAGQGADAAVPHRPGHRLHRLEIAATCGREAGLDHVDTHALQSLGDAHLLVAGHGRAWALLAVAQGGIEYDQLALLAHFPGSRRLTTADAALLSYPFTLDDFPHHRDHSGMPPRFARRWARRPVMVMTGPETR